MNTHTLSKTATPVLERLLRNRVLNREELVAAHNTYYYTNGGTVSIDLPEKSETIPNRIKEFSEVHHFDTAFVSVVEHAELFSSWGIGKTGTDKMILETTSNGDQTTQLWNTAPRFWEKVARDYVRDKKSTPIELSGTYFPLFGRWNGYFHWLFDHLPKLEGVERYEEETGESVTIILPPSPSQWMKESLRHVGYTSNNWIEWEWEHASTEKLLVPSLRRSRDILDPTAVFWLRNRVFSNSPSSNCDNDEFSRRIYVSRRDATTRKVINEVELMNAIRKYGFELYVPGKLSFQDQVQLYSQADMVVGPHGSNLANIVFSSDTDIIEFSYEPIGSACYHGISEILDIDYRFVTAKNKGGDIRVDVEKIEEAIINYLNNGSV
ncbi:DUF563 domain-containing protein [Natrinema versiforme]|nr:glycosyltransferase family 61 protein [Natrinema versiforme]